MLEQKSLEHWIKLVLARSSGLECENEKQKKGEVKKAQDMGAICIIEETNSLS